LTVGEGVSKNIFDVTFTARLEERTRRIEEGSCPWRESRQKSSGKNSFIGLEQAGDEIASYQKPAIPEAG